MSTIGVKIDALHVLREEKRAIEETLKAKTQEIDLAENELIDQMDAQSITKSTGARRANKRRSGPSPCTVSWGGQPGALRQTDTSGDNRVIVPKRAAGRLRHDLHQSVGSITRFWSSCLPTLLRSTSTTTRPSPCGASSTSSWMTC